jgi:hypothetical protein
MSGEAPGIRWFAWRAVREALDYGRTGGIALHRFRHDLRPFGLGAFEPACHMLSTNRTALVEFGARFGLRPAWLEPPRSRRPDIWHFDLFGAALRDLEAVYPPPEEVLGASERREAGTHPDATE